MRRTNRNLSATLLAAPLFALLLSACPPPSGRPDGGAVTNTGFCNLDAECRTGFRCDREMHRCVCTSDQACPAPLLCNAFTGQCVDEAQIPGCTSNGDCKASQYCDVPTRTCHARKSFCEPCESDAACGDSGNRCLTDPTLNRRFCGAACQVHEDCPEGATCQMVGNVRSCWPAVATCEQLKGCNPASGQACTTDEECTEGEDQACDKIQGTCVARIPTCPFGMVCNRDSHQCEAACTTDDECAADPKCQTTPCRCTNNECRPLLRCTQHADCEAGTICLIPVGMTEGECGPSCADDADCPQGEVCQSTGTRSVCTAACVTQSDCAMSENCDQSHCVSGCQTNEVCEPCQECRPVSGTRRNECYGVGSTYCQTCSASLYGDGCWKPGGGPSSTSYCCKFDTGDWYWGMDCSTRLCPRGFDCVHIVDGSGRLVAQNCFPLGTTCQAPTCN